MDESQQLPTAPWGVGTYNLNCYAYTNGVKGDWVGGADSPPNAIAVASAAFIAMQAANPRAKLGVCVLNGADIPQAWLGRAQ